MVMWQDKYNAVKITRLKSRHSEGRYEREGKGWWGRLELQEKVQE